jgi:hypothetical protein
MPDKAGRPEDELTEAIKKAIAAGAAAGAEETARRIAAAAATGLDEVKAVLRELAVPTAPLAVTVTGSFSLASMAVAGRVHVAAAALSGQGTLSVGIADLATAVEELRVIRQPDVDKLAERPPVSWSKQELVVNSLFLVAVTYWFLSPAEQQYLVNTANLVSAVVAIVALLKNT